MGKNQHVVPHHEKWAVRGEGNSRATSVHQNQAEAVEAATRIATHQKSEVLVHGADGKIREKLSHGHDPFPPAG